MELLEKFTLSGGQLAKLSLMENEAFIPPTLM
jgi:hypothetical protein